MIETKPAEVQKILYVFGGEKASGAEIVIERLMNYNTDKVEAHLFISPGDFANQLIADKKPYKITVIDFLRKLNRSSENIVTFYMKALRNYFVISQKVINYCKKNNITIIHANTIVPASYLIPAIMFSRALRLRKKWLWSDHDLRYFSKLDHAFSQLCVRLFDKTLTVSNAVRAKYGSAKSADVLYNGLDVSVFKPDNTARELFRKANNISENEILLGIAATISPRKGQLQLVEAFKKISNVFPKARLLIAGGLSGDSPEYNQQVLKKIAENSNVSYLGQEKEMLKFYNGCDIIINNSSIEGSEPLGTTIYEAMACEKVVIAAKTGGTPEIVESGIDGFLFEAEKESELKRCMSEVIVNMQLMDKIKTFARQKVERKFAVSTMVLRYNDIIKNFY